MQFSLLLVVAAALTSRHSSTAAAVQAAPTVKVSKTCIEKQEDVVIHFRNHDQEPRPDDWVGIYPHDYHPSEEPLYWVHTCGTDVCQQTNKQGIVSVAASLLPPGKHVAVLARDNPEEEEEGNEVYHVLGESQEFIIVRNTCAGPTSANWNATGVEKRQLQDGTSRMANVILSARADIWALMQNDISLPARYLRMVFHDCMGGSCDGCINILANGGLNGHNGIGTIMASLRDVALRYRDDLSRADIWALAAFVGVEFLMPPEDSISFPFLHYGRVDCPNMMEGPDHAVCGPNIGTNDMLAFMQDNFGYTASEVAVIMGAHTVGVLRQENLGFDGPNGWVANNLRFDNEYHQELVGRGGDLRLAPNWRQTRVTNTGDMPDRFQWVGFPGGRQVTMLNSDIAMVRQVDDGNRDRPSGQVGCTFTDQGGGNTCPPATRTLLDPMIRYARDNRVFLRDFYSAMVKMVDVGYQVDVVSCDSSNFCRLRQLG